jgi:hypothetical protein
LLKKRKNNKVLHQTPRTVIKNQRQKRNPHLKTTWENLLCSKKGNSNCRKHSFKKWRVKRLKRLRDRIKEMKKMLRNWKRKNAWRSKKDKTKRTVSGT